MKTMTESDLHQFTGTEQWYRHGLVRTVLYTDGVRYVGDHAGAYWLIDKIATLQLEPRIKREGFQIWRLTVTSGAAVLTCEPDIDEPSIHREEIAFTDFPLDKIEMWVEGNVILLPSEH